MISVSRVSERGRLAERSMVVILKKGLGWGSCVGESEVG